MCLVPVWTSHRAPLIFVSIMEDEFMICQEIRVLDLRRAFKDPTGTESRVREFWNLNKLRFSSVLQGFSPFKEYISGV